MTGDDKRNPATGVPSSREMPDAVVDLGFPLNIPGTDVVVSTPNFEVERAHGFGTRLPSLFPVPDEGEGNDAPKTQLTQGGPSRKGGIFSTLRYSLSRVGDSENASRPERQHPQNRDKERGSEKDRPGDGQDELTRMIGMLPLIPITSCLTIRLALLRVFYYVGISG